MNCREHFKPEFVNFLVRENIKTEKGDPLNFKSHYFLLDIYQDFSPLQVWYKAAQLGLSTTEIVKSLWLAHEQKMDIIYTLPTSDFAAEFVSTKVNRMIQANDIFQDWTKDRNTVEQKQVGQSVIYYRGAQIGKQAISVTSDLNIHDEIDRSDQAVIETYLSRLQHSKFKWRWHFSNPSLEGNGVSRNWGMSDQKHYFIKCSRCGKWQFMSFPESFDIDKKIYICKKCKQPLREEDRLFGEWIRKYKDRDWSGYWMPLFLAPWVQADEIIQKEQENTKEYFYNFVLGLPYRDNNATITQDVIFSHLKNEQPPLCEDDNLVMGCDSGIVKHWVMWNKYGMIDCGKTENWEDVELLILKYPRMTVCIDAMPDITEPRRIRKKYGDRIFLAFAGSNATAIDIVRFGEDENFGNVYVDRHRMIQHLVGEMVGGRIPFYGNQYKWQEYADHWKSMYRIIEKDKSDREKMLWKSKNGKDHYVTAAIYARCVMSRNNTGKSKTFGGVSESRLSRFGIKKEGAITFDN